MSKCAGCGTTLQCGDVSKEGYTSNINNKYCERCFKITHYNKYLFNDNDGSFYLKKLSFINKTGDLVILTVDFLNMFDFDSFKIKNPILLVFTKKDILPRSVNESKFLSKKYGNLNIKDKIFVSSKNNYNLDLLMDLIYRYKTSNNVYVCGLTNAGKSTLINKILKNYSDSDADITTSNLPSTTLDFLPKIVNDDLTLIDTPGLLDDGNIIFSLSESEIKNVIPNKEINPIIFQIKTNQSIVVEDFLRIDVPEDNNVILYLSNKLRINRFYKDSDKLFSLEKYEVIIPDDSDLVIRGLGFIKFKKNCVVNLYLKKGVNFFVRNSII